MYAFPLPLPIIDAANSFILKSLLCLARSGWFSQATWRCLCHVTQHSEECPTDNASLRVHAHHSLVLGYRFGVSAIGFCFLATLGQNKTHIEECVFAVVVSAANKTAEQFVSSEAILLNRCACVFILGTQNILARSQLSLMHGDDDPTTRWSHLNTYTHIRHFVLYVCNNCLNALCWCV